MTRSMQTSRPSRTWGDDDSRANERYASRAPARVRFDDDFDDDDRRYGNRHEGEGMATTLGWVSIAIGLAEILMPRQIDRLMGTGDGENAGTLRVMGIREICQGIDILAHDDPTPGVWARVAGDLIDGAFLGAAATRTESPAGLATVAAIVLPVVLADVAEAARRGAPDGLRRD